MADTKTTGLTANTTPVSTDIMYMVDDPGSSPLSQKMTLDTLRTFIKATGGRELISEQTPTGTGTVTWSSIPATYKSLEIEYVARGTQTAASTNIAIRFNNDTTDANYQRTIAGGAHSTAVTSGGDDAVFGAIAAASATAAEAGTGYIKIINYASTTFFKSALIDVTLITSTSASAIRYVSNVTWENAAAINRIDLILVANNYDTGSTFRLYGVN